MINRIKTRRFFKPQEKERIMHAIRHAESQTSGEIRVHVESHAGPDVLSRAKTVFENLGMTETALRNGVLIYLAVVDRKFAVLGDQGIDGAVPVGFWDETKERMQGCFRDGRFVDGVCLGIELAGTHLAEYFPCREDDVNELSNDISEGI